MDGAVIPMVSSYKYLGCVVHTYQQPVTYTFIIDPSFFTYAYDSCSAIYIGSCGVLVPMYRDGALK